VTKRTTVYAKSRAGVVFVKRGAVYGCVKRVGKVRWLAEAGDVLAPAPGLLRPAPVIAGNYIGLVVRRSPDGQTMVVFDARRNRRVLEARAHSPVTAGGYSDYIPDFVLKRNASVAWLGGAVEAAGGRVSRTLPTEVYKSPSDTGDRTPVLLDSDPHIQLPLRLDAARTTLSWTSNGQTRTSTLR
jgi:hypothetical protein